jgi:hypothetical protein
LFGEQLQRFSDEGETRHTTVDDCCSLDVHAAIVP